MSNNLARRAVTAGAPVAWLIGIRLNDLSAKVGTAGIDDTVTTIPLQAGYTGFVADGATIQIGDEQITVGTFDSANDQLTGCTRGANATTAAAHSAGDSIVLLTLDVSIAEPNMQTTNSTGIERFGFDGLSAGNMEVLGTADSAAANSTNNVDFTHADGLIVRFGSKNKVLDGNTGADITPEGESSDNTGLGTASLTTLYGDVEATSKTDMLNRIKASKTNYFLIVMPTGYYGDVSNSDVDGWAYMIGKRTSNLSVVNNSDPVTVEFTSYKLAGSEAEHQAAFATGFGSITTADGVTLTPATLSNADAVLLGKGEVVLKEAA